MAVVYTGSLGWVAGQNINSELASQLGAMTSGDVLVFDETYILSNNPQINVPNGVTIAASKAGAGVELQGWTVSSAPSLVFGANCTMLDFTARSVDGGEDPIGQNGTPVAAENGNFTMINSLIAGPQKELLRLSGDGFTCTDSEFIGGFYQILMAVVTNFTITRTLFRESTGDGIKTVRAGAIGCADGTLTDCVFINSPRDGIDTTGGWLRVHHEGCYFVSHGVAGMDLKQSPQEPSHNNPDLQNQYITVSNCEFINAGSNAIVLTTNDRGELGSTGQKVLDNDNFYDWCPQDITVENSIFEGTGLDSKHICLAKGGINMAVNNSQWLGIMNTYRTAISPYTEHVTIDQNINLTTSNITTGSFRPVQPDSYYYSLAGVDQTNPTYGPSTSAGYDGTLNLTFNG